MVLKRPTPSEAVTDMADERAPHQVTNGKYAERGKKLGDGVLVRWRPIAAAK
jgi:hypothetical protein